MKKYPIWQNGEKLVTEDLNALALLAGASDDGVRASTKKVFVEDTERKGWLEPWRDGPIVIPSGSDGKVVVQPFTMFMSPAGATSNQGSESASGGSETSENLKSARYEGGTISIPTPFPSSGNMRWDLLYATISEADSDAASRLVATVSGSTKVVAVQTINTRHKASVTLAWVQGTASPTATDPYPLANLPTLPTASAGTANVPLAYVQVQNSGTPSTVQYTKDRIANWPRLAIQNPQTGAIVAASGIASGRPATSGAFLSYIEAVLTTASSAGGWAPTGTNIRPVRFFEPMTGGIDLWIPIGPFSSTVGNKTFGTTFAASPLINIAAPQAGHALYDNKPWDWRNRFFHSSLIMGTVANSFAWDLTGANAYMPSSLQTSGDPKVLDGWGQSIKSHPTFDALLSGFYLAGWFHDVCSAGANDDLALLVDKSSGYLYLAGRDTSGALNQSKGMLHLHVSGQTFPYGL